MRLRLLAFACVALAAACSLDRVPSQAGKRGGNGAGGAADGGNVALAGSGGGLGGGASGSSAVPTTDGGVDACGGCDDGVFCNGAEVCMPADANADKRGCILVPACFDSQRCDEAQRTCATSCAQGKDADADGFDAVDCGGEDCNDAAPAINPSGAEACDGFDNDCNGLTDDGPAGWSCLRANTLASCSFGKCMITFCSNGYADCDLSVDNGCEVQLDPTAGDCTTSDCAGNALASATDVPADDGNDCTVESCNGMTPVVEDAQNGASCGSGDNQGVCAKGACQAD